MSTPTLVGQDATGKFNIVQWGTAQNPIWYAIPIAMGPVDLTTYPQVPAGSGAVFVEGVARYDSLLRAQNPGLINPAANGHLTPKMTQLTKG
jgi:hypothetical protein